MATAVGWLLGVAALVLAVTRQRELERRMEALARASHELRRPLTAARLAVAPLGERAAPVDAELRRATLALADLEAIRGAGGPAERHDLVAVEELLRDVVAAWQPTARAAGRELRLDAVEPGAAAVHGHVGRIFQAVGNLVANALDHGAGDVGLAARAGAHARVRLEVRDAGPGLPAPVEVLAARARGGRGTRGRGLAIAAAIARRHGGRLAAAPSAHGARVVLDLPAAEPGARERALP